MTRTVQTLPPSCPLEIRGQVAGAGRCPLVAATPSRQHPECCSDLHVCRTDAACAAGAPRGQVGGSSEAAPAGIRGQQGAGRGQQKSATCPHRIRHLTWGFVYQGAVRAALSRKFGSSRFAKSHIAPHIDHSSSRFLSPQKSCPENLPLLPPDGPVRAQWAAAKPTRAGHVCPATTRTGGPAVTELLRRFTITLPPGLRLLNANQRIHYRVRAEVIASLRGAAMAQCSEDPTMRAALGLAPAGQPLLRHAYILGVLHPPSRRRADPANWYGSFKAAIDGLVDAGVLEDDDHTRVVGPDMRIGPVAKGGQIALHIQELTPEQHAAFVWQEAAAS